MLLFKTGTFRVMGKNLDCDTAQSNACIVLRTKTRRIPNIILQTMAGVYNWPQRLHLDKLSIQIQGDERKTQCHYDAEHFPAVQIIRHKPIHVNAFATGKIVFCGLKTIDSATEIIIDLLPVLESCSVC